jgi:hypothetical protein
MMLTMTSTRKETGDEGTFSLLESEALEMHIGELPWRNNERRISCIPSGIYLCKPHISPKFGKCFWLQDVPGRSEILIHVANWMGSKESGFKSDLLGCLAIGMKMVKDVGPNDQDMIQQSKIAMDKLIEYTEFKPFMLEIINHTGTEMTA